MFKTCDSAGIVTNDAYDFKGNLLRTNRQLCRDHDDIPDWSKEPKPEDEIFASLTRYDALNRSTLQISPHDQNDHSPTFAIQQPTYNEAGLLEAVHIWLDQTSVPHDLLDPATADHAVVKNIDYDARGQRLKIAYGNDAETRYVYDRETFRLTRLYTRRSKEYDQDCGIPPELYAATDIPPPDQPCGIQNITYTYDPVGNITHLHDLAQSTVYFANQCIDAGNEYQYDPLYRLIAASGREHGSVTAPGAFDGSREAHAIPVADPQAMCRYTEQYAYDAVGNFLQMSHQSVNGNWRRCYQYATDSNRLLSTGRPTDPGNTNFPCPTHYSQNPVYENHYGYDAHGNMTSMPHLSLFRWDYQDRLLVTARQVVNETPPPDKVTETTWYVYDASGQRVRKVTEGPNGQKKDERIYLGGFELYRQYRANGTKVKLERETLHVMDDNQRVAMIEIKTVDNANDRSPARLIRYQINNHLGSATVELNENAQVISYEEYYPYGGTAYQAKNKEIKAAAKRYRYTGKERDEENGFYYYGARYYAARLGRWVSCDPIKTIDSSNLYLFSLNNPIRLTDFTGTQTIEAAQPDLVKKIRVLETTVRNPAMRFFPLQQYWYTGGQGGEYKMYFGKAAPWPIRPGREENVWYHPLSKQEINEMTKLKSKGVFFLEEEFFPAWFTKISPEFVRGKMNFFNRRQIFKYYAHHWIAGRKKQIEAMVMSWKGAADIGFMVVFTQPRLASKPSIATTKEETSLSEASHVPIIGNAQKTGTLGHVESSIRAAEELATQPDAETVYLQRAYSTMSGTKTIPRRIPDVGMVSNTGSLTVVEVLSKSDWRNIKFILEVIKRNLKAMNQLPPEKQGGVFIIWPKQ